MIRHGVHSRGRHRDLEMATGRDREQAGENLSKGGEEEGVHVHHFLLDASAGFLEFTGCSGKSEAREEKGVSTSVRF